MLLFNEKIFEGYVVGASNVFTNTLYGDGLASVDLVTVTGTIKQVQGTSPTFTCQFEHSFDGTRWFNQNSTPEANAISLGAGDNTIVPFSNFAGNVHLGFYRLRIELGGTGPSGVVLLFAAGRAT